MIRKLRWLAAVLTTLALCSGSSVATAGARALSVDVWTDRGDDAVYRPGEAMQVKVRANDDAYLLVYEIDSEGKVTVLYPWRRGAGRVEGQHTYRLPQEGSPYELTVESAIGQGYLVAIASREPFRDLPWYLRPFDPQAETIGYEGEVRDEEGFDEDGNVLGDPTVAIERIRRRVLDNPSATDAFATAYSTYYVGHEVRYPRYLCSDCHRPGQWAWWDGFDPYYSTCSVFDFRVNWNWGWGPPMWSGHVPYYYYVVRTDCPPRYRDWYEDHRRWSSWDERRDREDLWGGPLVRYKSPPPQGYVPPPIAGKPGHPGATPLPPGYIPPGTSGHPRAGRGDMPVGHSGRGDRDGSAPGTVWRGGSGTPTPRGDTWRQPANKPSDPPSSTPRGDYGTREREKPTPASPPREDRGDKPRRDPPRQDPPREERHSSPLRQDPPRQDPPRQDPPRQDPPRYEKPAPPPPPAQESAPQRPAPSRQPSKKDDGGHR